MGSSQSTPISPEGYYIHLNSDSCAVLDNEWTSTSDHKVVQNIGRTPIAPVIINSGKKIVCSNIAPGETRVFEGRLGLVNVNKERAIIHCRGGNLESTTSSSLSRNLYTLSNIAIVVSKCVALPTLSSLILTLQGLYNSFWPEEKPNVWEEIEDKIYNLLDENTKSIIKAFLENDIKVYKDKLTTLIEELNENINIKQHYMAIAYDFIGLERKFQYSNTIRNHEKINLSVLPLLGYILSLKMNFYLIGIRFSKEINLTKNDVLQIKKYALDTYKHAFPYITSMEKSVVDHVYNNADTKDMFNQIMTQRTFLAEHGLKYLPVWNYELENPMSEEEIYNPVMSYSNFFGKITPDLFAQATAEEVPPPLCPKLIDGKRNKLKKVLIYLCHNVIFGAKLCFENGDEYDMGTKTNSMMTMELSERKILKITAYGEGKIDGLLFILSDKTAIIFGKTNSHKSHEFSLEDHHIPSFYLSSDSITLGGQAANIAVSFQWYMTVEKSKKKNYFYSIYKYLTERILY